MFILARERLGLFIDGADLQSTSRALGFNVDFKRLLSFFRQQGQLVRAVYYVAWRDDEEANSARPLVDWLQYNGYATVTKPSNRGHERCTIDVELAVDAMRYCGFLDHILLFSGNGEFKALVAGLQEQGKRVTVVSTLATKPAAIADGLRRQADQFVDITEIESQIRLAG